jgi:oleate hydratase
MTTTRFTGAKAYFVGGGIASLAGAAYLIRDGDIAGENITIFEESSMLGGSLDGQGSPEQGYVMRGGRMFTDEAYTCTYDLMSFIPTLADPEQSVREEMRIFNEEVHSHSEARLVVYGEKLDTSSMGFSARDRLSLTELFLISEEALGAKRIDDYFEPSFFITNFWYMWCTTFAFQPWHSLVEFKRYCQRFLQEFHRINTLGGVKRTPLNQYDSLVRPLKRWLNDRGVKFVMNSQVVDLDLVHGPDGKSVAGIKVVSESVLQNVAVSPLDFVFVTNGSMTAASSFGTMSSPAPLLGPESAGGAWALWETLAAKDHNFGHPSVFSGHVAESNWISFTTTLRDPLFFQLMEQFTGNAAGTGGLVTFPQSNWLMSVVLAYQPHFLNQPKGVNVFWGYGLYPDQPGNYVQKKMSECSGAEILTELCGHLRFDDHLPKILETSNCIPCRMPYITSQFMPRVASDRPLVRPAGTTNLAFIGQYCELPDDVVFTVEYSVRSAQTAVFSLLGSNQQVSPLYKGQHDPGVLLSAVETLFK